jgi:hypothetical protein
MVRLAMVFSCRRVPLEQYKVALERLTNATKQRGPTWRVRSKRMFDGALDSITEFDAILGPQKRPLIFAIRILCRQKTPSRHQILNNPSNDPMCVDGNRIKPFSHSRKA